MIATLCRPKVRHGRQNPAYRGVDCLRLDKKLVMGLVRRLRGPYLRCVLHRHGIGFKRKRA